MNIMFILSLIAIASIIAYHSGTRCQNIVLGKDDTESVHLFYKVAYIFFGLLVTAAIITKNTGWQVLSGPIWFIALQAAVDNLLIASAGIAGCCIIVYIGAYIKILDPDYVGGGEFATTQFRLKDDTDERDLLRDRGTGHSFLLLCIFFIILAIKAFIQFTPILQAWPAANPASIDLLYGLITRQAGLAIAFLSCILLAYVAHILRKNATRQWFFGKGVILNIAFILVNIIIIIHYMY